MLDPALTDLYDLCTSMKDFEKMLRRDFPKRLLDLPVSDPQSPSWEAYFDKGDDEILDEVLPEILRWRAIADKALALLETIAYQQENG